MADKKRYYLSGTPLLPREKLDGTVIFLSDPLANNSLSARLLNKDYEIMPKLWNDKERLKDASDYLDKIYEDMTEKLGTRLSAIHGVQYPPSFWEIPMASWLLHYIHSLYDRYARFENAIRLYGKDNISAVACKYDFSPPSNAFEFIDKMSEDDIAASYLYGAVAGGMGIDLLEFKFEAEPGERVANLSKKTKVFTKNFYHRIYNRIKSEIEGLAVPKLLKTEEILMSPRGSGFSRRDEAVLSRKANFSFMNGKGIQLTRRSIDRNALLSVKAIDEFEALSIKLLPVFMPTHLLEEFAGYCEEAKKLSHFKVYFAVTDWHPNILFGYAASLGRMNKAKIVGCQHGGGYGQYENMHYEFIERRFTDYYITWGWSDNFYDGAKLLPLPQPKLSNNLNRHRPASTRAVWCGAGMPKQIVRFQYYIPDNLSSYLENKKKFVDCLKKEVRGSVTYRPYPRDYCWGGEERDIFKDYPEVRIDNDEPIYDLLGKVKLYICDHQSTSFMEAFAVNTPTIIFWGEAFMNERDSAVPAFETLRKAGILFHDPAEAAAKVNDIWDDVQGWWMHPDRQNARARFMDSFCRAAPDWRERWIETFRKMI